MTRTLAFLLCIFTLMGITVSTGGPRGLPFYGPDNIVFDTSGDVFVTDADRQREYFRIIELDRAGKYVAEWHVFAASGDDSGPEGIAWSRGRIYATDAGAHQVLVLSRSGRIIARWGTRGSGPGEFEKPGHVAVDLQGDVYVADAAENTIQRFSPQGHFLSMWRRSRGSGLDQFNGPEGIQVDARGNVFVEDWRNHRILKLAPSGVTLRVFGNGAGESRVVNDAGMAIDAAANVYVADWARHRIVVFDSDGHFLRSIENDGSGPPKFDKGPTSIAIDASGDMYYADGTSIRALDSRGRLIHVWK